MGDVTGIVVVLAVGLPILILAMLLDRRRRLAREVETAAAPLRGSDTVDALVPVYIPQERVDSLPSPGAGVKPGEGFSGGVLLDFGHVDEDFATAGTVAEYEDAAVLMVDDTVTSMRELLTPLGAAASGRPLVIAASAFHPEVLESLRANRRATLLPVVVVEANLAELMLLQDQVGGEVLAASDLKAGWLPASAFGSASRWRSDMRSVRVLPAVADKG